MLRARVEVRGAEIRYRQWGTAETPPLVLAHGLPDGGFVWTKLAEQLQDVRRILAFDLPGFGDSPAPRGFAHTVAAYGEIFDGFVEALRLDRFDLGVHDISAAYALPPAAERASAIGGLLMLNTQPFAGWRWHAIARRYRTPLVGRLMTLRPPRAAFERRLRPAFANDPPRWYLDGLWDVWRRGPSRRAVMTFYRRDEPEAWEPAEGAIPALRGVPSVVVWGDADPFIHRSVPERIGEAFAARVVRLEGAGHFPMVERPDAVARAYRSMIG